MWLPIGLGWTSLEPIGWALRPGEHLLVAGPARSGRTTALCTAASVLGRLRPDWPLIAVGARHPLPSDVVAAHVGPHDLPELAALLGAGATATGRPSCSSTTPTCSTTPPASWRRCWPRPAPTSSSWRPAATTVCVASTAPGCAGCACPVPACSCNRTPTLDGDLLGVRLPRRPLVRFGPGRGYLVEAGSVEIVQVARQSDPRRVSGTSGSYRDLLISLVSFQYGSGTGRPDAGRHQEAEQDVDHRQVHARGHRGDPPHAVGDRRRPRRATQRPAARG